MKLFITGATGVLGRRLVKGLTARGHTVLGLARDDRGDAIVRAAGGEPKRADLFDAEALATAADGADVLIHAATSIPVTQRPKPAEFALNDKIRTEGTRALAACGERIGARALVYQSTLWVVQPADNGAFDESAPQVTDPMQRASWEGEQIARSFRSGAVLRCGWFYGPDAAHTRMFGQGLSKGRMPIIGSGTSLWSMLHLDDAASAFIAAAEGNRAGTWHVLDDGPVKVADFLTTFARLLNAKPPRHVPAFLARLVAGKSSVDFLTRSVITTGARFRSDFGWKPAYPTHEAGLAQVVNTWREEGLSW